MRSLGSIPACAGGTISSLEQGVSEAGLSPACAGEPPVGVARELELRVYPRVCGGTSVYANQLPT